MENKLPLYKIKVNPEDESGVYMVSLVTEPAIEENWIKLSKQIEMTFSANKDKQLLYGPMLIPNKMIYRRDDNGYEYNIMFDAETIELIAEKFKMNKLNDQFNFQHSNKTVNAFLKEDWIIENPDKSQKYGFDLPDGTWFGAVKVQDEDFWNTYVKGEEVKGFSVELRAGAELVELSVNNKLNNNTEMEKTELGMVKREDGVEVYFDGETVEVGTPLFLDPEMTEKAPEGEHTLENGVKVVLDAEGKVVEVIEADTSEEEMSEELAEETTEELAEETTEEATEELEEEPSFDEKVLAIVQPLLDKVTEQATELMNKFADVEAKLAENAEAKTEVNELRTQIEKLSKTAGAETVTKKDDKRAKVEHELSKRINIFRNIK